MLDENLVEAAQTLRALEDGDEEDFYPIEPSIAQVEVEEIRPAKKVNANGGGHGLFDEEAMDNLRFYAEMARKQANEEAERKRKLPSRPVAVASLLGGYDSANESD